MTKKSQNSKAVILRDSAISIGILASASLVCLLLKTLDDSDNYIPFIFMLAIFLISRFTDGYVYGIVSSLIAVIVVNYLFTYPYLAFNFTISGYPITFICFLVISIITSALTTQIKRQEKMRAEAEREKMRANLLRAVSHDLRTPLTSIVGATSAVLENGGVLPPEKQRELLADVCSEAQWLIRMVENLLSVTRISDGTTKIEKTEEAVEEVAGEAVRKFNKRFPQVKVSVSVPEALLFVPMDAILIEQVLLNLLENAILHGKNPDGIEIEVQDLETSALFSVRDRGVGIPESLMSRLWNGGLPKEKEEPLADGRRNMGIGLSVCVSIVRAHGGEMSAGNRKGGGAVFEFTLPKKEGDLD